MGIFYINKIKQLFKINLKKQNIIQREKNGKKKKTNRTLNTTSSCYNFFMKIKIDKKTSNKIKTFLITDKRRKTETENV